MCATIYRGLIFAPTENDVFRRFEICLGNQSHFYGLWMRPKMSKLAYMY